MPPERAVLLAPAMAPQAPSLAAWRPALTALAAAALALVAVTARQWGAMLHQWWHIDTYHHLLLVPLIIGWLVALKRDELTRFAPQPFAPGLIGVAAALGVSGVGAAMDINLIAQAGAVGALQAAVVTLLGLRASLVLAVPLGFAAFLVPFGDEIIAPLQHLTAKIAIALLHAGGVPARIEGIYIHTPAGLFVVAEACAGVKFLMATVTLGVLVCFTRLTRWSRRAALLAACIIIPVLANGARAAATILVAQHVGAERATGFDHIVYGWVFFALVLWVVLGAARRWFERAPEAHGFSAAAMAGWPWLVRLERRRLAPGGAGLAVIALAAIAGLVRLL